MITYIANLLISPIGNISFQVRAIFSFFHTECLNKQVLISRKLFDIENFHSKDKKSKCPIHVLSRERILGCHFHPSVHCKHAKSVERTTNLLKPKLISEDSFFKKKYLFLTSYTYYFSKVSILYKKNVAHFSLSMYVDSKQLY